MFYYTMTTLNELDFTLYKEYGFTKLLAVEHSGTDKNGLPIRPHIHYILKSNKIVEEVNYTINIIFFSCIPKVSELGSFVKYLTNKHCDYKVLSKSNEIDMLIENSRLLDTTSKNLEAYQLLQDFYKLSHNELLMKYGYTYLRHYRTLMCIVDDRKSLYLNHE